MEDIYDDLTNYEDVNALEELRNENKELKDMLDKRSAAMEKLQKDYDFLEAEFKKLEHNYSSLLMTARAEIERKTKRINQLNTEKDMMVLNALKSGTRVRRNFSNGQTKYEVAPGKGNNNKSKENIVKQKKEDIKQDRREAPVLPPKVAVPESGASNKNKSDNAGIKVELSSTRKSNVNENIAQPKTDLKEPPKASASSIKNRRKSMPAVSMPIDTFSSDDELERNHKTKDTRTDQIQSDKERRNTNKMPIDKNSDKTSETSSMDDRKQNYHDPTSRDNYKGRPSRQQVSSSYRSRDKYEVSLKNRKLYSPERGLKRQHREHQDDYHRYERERYKGRSLESPPPESYSRYNRRKSEHRSDYDRYSHDYEKMRHHYDDKYSSSKRSKDYDEPHAKRQRTESYGNPNAHSKEDKRQQHEREPVDGQPVPCFSPHEYDMLRYSCQSPDFVYTDAGHTNPIKEIRQTAAVPLEDPRKTSKKYVIWKENGKETLSTVVGRDIDIIPVKKAAWNVKRVDIPVALVRRPSECSDQLVKDIYMDIDNPVTNLDFSVESDEVRETDEEINEIRSKPKEIKHDTHDFKISKQVTKDLSRQPTDVKATANTAGYRIPKVGQNIKNTRSKMDVPIIELDENLPHHKNANRKSATEGSFPRELITHKQQYSEQEQANIEDSLRNNKNYGQKEHIKNAKSREAADGLQKELTTHRQKYNEREERVQVEDSIHSKNYCQKEHIKNIKTREAESTRKELSTHKQQYNESEERVQVEDFLPDSKKYNQLEHTKKSRTRETGDSLRKELSTGDIQERMHVKDSIPNDKKYSKLERNKTSTSKEKENSFRKELSTHKQQYNEREEGVSVKVSLPNNKKYSKLETKKKSSSTETIADLNQSTLNKMAIVADDLELSDDNSDHTDTNKTAPTQSQNKCEKPINVNDAKITDSGNNADDKTLTSSHNTEIERTVDTAGITDGTEEEKCKESDSTKKHKTKRKKSKSISKDFINSRADAIHDFPEKKSKSKKEKESIPQETKEKFSDLFGDSSSLMTPEDLGIPSYLPISEDAQDAVDIKINQIIDGTQLNDEIPKHMQIQNGVEIKIPETEAHNNIPKAVLQKSNTDVDDKEVTEIKKKSSKRNKENVIEPSQLPSPIVYENLNPGTDLNDPNVVKTVIISTGKQPEIAYENSVEVTKPAESIEVNSMQSTKDNIHLIPATKEYKTDLLKALATSTPHKEFSAVNAPLPDAAKTDVICDPCVSKAVATITSAEPVVNQTEINTESNDAPDVRIFVKRRRKTFKRPPMT